MRTCIPRTKKWKEMELCVLIFILYENCSAKLSMLLGVRCIAVDTCQDWFVLWTFNKFDRRTLLSVNVCSFRLKRPSKLCFVFISFALYSISFDLLAPCWREKWEKRLSRQENIKATSTLCLFCCRLAGRTVCWVHLLYFVRFFFLRLVGCARIWISTNSMFRCFAKRISASYLYTSQYRWTTIEHL